MGGFFSHWVNWQDNSLFIQLQVHNCHLLVSYAVPYPEGGIITYSDILLLILENGETPCFVVVLFQWCVVTLNQDSWFVSFFLRDVDSHLPDLAAKRAHIHSCHHLIKSNCSYLAAD